MSEPICCNCASECINAGGTAAHWCIYHTPDYKALEQRYQKLEQVAKDMYRYMDGVLNKNWRIRCHPIRMHTKTHLKHWG